MYKSYFQVFQKQTLFLALATIVIFPKVVMFIFTKMMGRELHTGA